MAKNKVNITISNQTYTVISSEDSATVKKLEETVNKKVSEIMSSAKITLTEALVLVALDLANEAKTHENEVKKLRNDMAGYLEDVENITIERDKLKRELDKIKG